MRVRDDMTSSSHDLSGSSGSMQGAGCGFQAFEIYDTRTKGRIRGGEIL